MLKVFSLFFFALFLTACAAPLTEPAPTVVSVTASPIIPTLTATLAPSETPSTTPTITTSPTPETPTPIFSPTFDVRTIVTVTPAPKGDCPVESASQPKLIIPTSTPRSDNIILGAQFATYILPYLNSGGKMSAVAQEIDRIDADPQSHSYAKYHVQDVTGDGLDDMIFYQPGQIDTVPVVFLCDHGSYTSVALTPNRDYLISTQLEGTVDLNGNGIPEIIVSSSMCGGTSCGERVYTFEWDGQSFQPYSNFFDYIYQITFRDADQNGTTDIVALVTGSPGGSLYRSEYLPKRQHTLIYGWNGNDFVQIDDQYAAPEYRFQAVQDADHLTQRGKYAEAFKMYQAVVSNKSLGWWSQERKNYLAVSQDVMNSVVGDESATPYPTPIPDLTEYPKLAAYATYRMVILHIYLGEMDEAQKQYDALQAKFPMSNSGHLYVEMAAAFWDAYQSTKTVYNACDAAVAYADAHPEIVTPLGSDYHGWQSKIYTSSDVCPFR